MRRTPLYPLHRELKARFFSFAGYEMPLQYTSILEEAKVVREGAGVFDVSHMGRLYVKGKNSLVLLEKLTTRQVEKLRVGKVQYNLISNPEGGIKDDVTIYRLDEDVFMICVNAINREKIVNWFSQNQLEVEDVTEKTVQIALQGKTSSQILSKFFPIDDIRYYHFKVVDSFLVSRTGYTGEDGFEIYAPVEEGKELWSELVKWCPPCGLGARDVLRIEAGLVLYGHEISETISPLEAGLERYVSFQKEFIGKEAMLSKEVRRRLYGLKLLQKGVPREGSRIFLDGKEIGVVSSGSFSPVLNRGIALAFVDKEFLKEGLRVKVVSGNRELDAVLKAPPFVRKGS
ncbi:glycine cleavage system T protein [Thermocrinis albus DSM 14484]|uniref:Aminomethyltransferase n=1 Tax=Thermocrinis albus (strain DSM 14484 / JCM 11386 / HI 11/12) TaxID=638303 RepID=D3SNT0_THEAH|nr:glycine cleavage system aminomethyltransferase GcvT [Thermocrinis albus]ADC88817.1 glycine cleavage system T protein [Thermocrinis albus DSM 14484]